MAVTEDRRRITIRLVTLQVGAVVVFAALTIAFWFLQIVQNNKFEEMAENNHQRTLALRAPRGVLFDRQGKVLVENRHAYRSRSIASAPKTWTGRSTCCRRWRTSTRAT